MIRKNQDQREKYKKQEYNKIQKNVLTNKKYKII